MPKHGGDQGGRPTKLTPPLLKQLEGLIAHGNYKEIAAASVGINRDTIQDWLKRGARSTATKEIPKDWKDLDAWHSSDVKAKDDRIYKWFSVVIEKAEATWEVDANLILQKHSLLDGNLLFKRLQNMKPERYKAPQHIEATTTSRVTLDDVTQLDDEELDARLAAFEQHKKPDET